MDPTVVTWALIVWGVITLAPLAAVQFVFLLSPNGTRSKEWLIGEGEDWRDRTHFRLSLGAAWAVWLVAVPLFVVGGIGIVAGEEWGYLLFGASGAISLYINIILWFTEKAYVYPSRGPLRYFTYYWGFFVYWGAAAVIYCSLRLGGVDV